MVHKKKSILVWRCTRKIHPSRTLFILTCNVLRCLTFLEEGSQLCWIRVPVTYLHVPRVPKEVFNTNVLFIGENKNIAGKVNVLNLNVHAVMYIDCSVKT